MTRWSMHLKVMSRLYKGHRYILVVIDKGTNFIINDPIYQSRLEEIGNV